MERDLMEREWEGWRFICRELESLGINLNDQDRLACAMRLWGERLAALRIDQPQHIVGARDEHEAAYLAVTNNAPPEVFA